MLVKRLIITDHKPRRLDNPDTPGEDYKFVLLDSGAMIVNYGGENHSRLQSLTNESGEVIAAGSYVIWVHEDFGKPPVRKPHVRVFGSLTLSLDAKDIPEDIQKQVSHWFEKSY